ncbi:hypothetical protein B0H14DRAFT_2647588 [Mycena olivaceomarginata]|uniref:Uncharacterized protein n=1 Tax=Mycena albidolilacea TaxID=1033008 RepID=A0AAD7ACH1_9AGAR|nr:hypothetical protein DFH08DRAFT_803254 [Mycena albidolilacea]KAJ7704628.1 hypothetical protein B0H14DRAFT_2647588 [Mycena olivaceomarginata]
MKVQHASQNRGRATLLKIMTHEPMTLHFLGIAARFLKIVGAKLGQDRNEQNFKWWIVGTKASAVERNFFKDLRKILSGNSVSKRFSIKGFLIYFIHSIYIFPVAPAPRSNFRVSDAFPRHAYAQLKFVHTSRTSVTFLRHATYWFGELRL